LRAFFSSIENLRETTERPLLDYF